MRTRNALVTLATLALAINACNGDGSSPPPTTPQTTMTTVTTTIATTLASATLGAAERDASPSVAEDVAEPFDFDAFAAAWGSGDGDQIRAFYTDDAVMMPEKS